MTYKAAEMFVLFTKCSNNSCLQFFLSAFFCDSVVFLAGFLHNCMLYTATRVSVSASDMEIATKIHYVDSMNHSTTHTQFLPKLT